MHTWKTTTRALCALALAGSLAACGDFLTGTDLDTDPNRPTNASRDQLFVAMQAKQQAFHEGHVARVVTMWVQQFAGTDRQYIPLDQYDVAEGEFNPQFSGLYTGGGLVDMRRIVATAEADGDRRYAGIVKVWEAFTIGMAASLWGDIPYSEAVGDNPTPKLDPQAEVYAAVQNLLNAAITDLQSGTGRGPGAADFIYGGDATKWIQAANTLKARFHLHMAEREGNTRYTAALAAAQGGISAPANDFRTFHTTQAGEENIWFQFQVRERDTYLRGGAFAINLLQSRNDPRLQQYYAPAAGGQFVGARPGEAAPGASNLSAARLAPAFRQPLITYAENQLIMAEANFRLGNSGPALQNLNNARTAAGVSPVSGVAGNALLQEILTEKYLALFQNMEAWNDYKRTCFPNVTPAVAGQRVPGRLLYGNAERNVNPNIPSVSTQLANPRNFNDPNPCS
jgi:hypothetical protein